MLVLGEEGEHMRKRTFLAILTVAAALLVAGLTAFAATAHVAPPDADSVTTTEPTRTPQAEQAGTECCPAVPAPRPAQGHRIGTPGNPTD
jgi:hypothetical protein